MLKSLLFSGCAAVCLSTGCAKQQQFKAVEQICIKRLATENTEKLKMQVMKIAEEVLGEIHFTIEKSDPKSGYIRTRPLTGAQFFEFWRSDNVGGFNWSEANLHSIRRIVELEISQQDGQLCINCDVHTQRLNLPERQVSGSSRAYAMFSASDPIKQRLKLHAEQKKGMTWVDLGRDMRLETEILRRIENQITKLQKEKRL